MVDQSTDQPAATATAPSKAPDARKARRTARASAKRLSANDMAQRLSKAHGVTVTAKAVRQWCRDNVTAYGDDRYTVHAYDAATVKRIEAAWKQRTARRTASRNGGKA